MAASRLDLAILREIVRIVQEKARVPEKVRILKRYYVLTYLEDHRQRMEEALRRFDSDRVNMLFGQLASKVKYQMVRMTGRRPAAATAKRSAKPKAPLTPKPAAEPVRAAKTRPAAKRPKTPKEPAKRAQAKRNARPQRASRPKRVTQPKRAARSRAAAARKLKVKKRSRPH